MDIIINKLSKAYSSQQVLDSFSHTFEEGSFSCIMGKSGVGKTTLLYILMGLEKADSGTITGLEDKRISAVFQENRLCDNITAAYNIKMVIEKDSIYTDSDIEKYLERMGIDSHSKKPVKEFSGGMKRRVSILRALMADFDLLIMDEPLKGLDSETKKNVVALIKELSKGKTVIMTTHDPSEIDVFNGILVKL